MQLQFVEHTHFGEKHLLPSSDIVQSPDFETGIVKLCNSDVDSLSYSEKEALKDFIVKHVAVSSGDDDVPVALRALKRRRTTKSDSYTDVSWIPPTSNCVERFFSVCKQVLLIIILL